ncbi:FAD-dependent monooxygenase [Hymenobacter crusticola]|uniref:FAD-binding domain-containing protein n=1 Tax=Hymenobacter crusticola TaxID=1770526 RepID=A0A243WAC4_9BACT|nr:FAD-dependent monooxygenase [Hymenobacter crusticola]OUJ72499.1 hypothetical protein BXP70_18235 [Hymenobacter crusticola]
MHFLIIGAGINGLTTARALLNLGHTVQVFEAARELREIGAGVVLGANAMRALQQLGLYETVQAYTQPVKGLRLLDHQGRALQTADTEPFTRKLGFDNVGIHRADLQKALLSELPSTIVHLGKPFVRFEEKDHQVTAHFADGSTATGDALLAADGIRSRVRLQLLPQSQPRYAGYTCWRAVVDAASLGLPPGNSTEIWGTRGRRFGYVPLVDGRVYWFACVNTPTPNDPVFKNLHKPEVEQLFADLPYPAPALLAHTPADAYLWGDILDIKPIRRFAYGRVLLLGDAAHATTPNLGQGAGQAVEDAAILARCLEQNAELPAAFREFERRRRPRTTRIVQTSWFLGWASQIKNPFIYQLRNTVMRLLPAAVAQWQMAFLYEADD